MKQKLILLLITLLISFALIEITFTIIVDEDLDGNLSLNHVHLKPYKLPILETKSKIEELLQHRIPDSLSQQYDGKDFKRNYFNVRLVPDSILGWSPNPYFKSSDELYIYDRDGIRSNDILSTYDKKTKLRIAIFGDSYSHSDEVKFQNTIGNYLQNILDKQNIEAEVLNFAVSGYGMDQAFLRWESVKEKFQPDIILLGVQFENVKRHINLLRPFYFYTTEIPYSKPRFVLSGNKLHLIKNPIAEITNTVDIIRNFDSWKFSHFEGFYKKEDYEFNPYYLSKSISFVSSAISQILEEVNYYNSDRESYQVTYKILEQFNKSVLKENAIFIPLHLPVMNDFDFVTQNFIKTFYDQEFIYDDLFSTLKLQYNFVEPYKVLNKRGARDGFETLFLKRHYSSTSNKIIANQIFKFIMNNHHQLLKSNERQK